MKIKPKIIVVFFLNLLFLLIGCSNINDKSQKETVRELTKNEIKQMYSDPKKYKNSTVEIVGQVFSEIEHNSDGIYFQMWGNPEKAELNTVVHYSDANFELKPDDYVKIKGRVFDAFEGENMMGGKIFAPVIKAESIQVLSYKDAVVPTIKEITQDNLQINQLGYEISIDKIEFAEKETRVYVKIKNNGKENLDIYEFNSKLIQDGVQYDIEDNYLAKYPKIQNHIRTGIKSEGIIVFPKIDMKKDFQIIIVANSDNYEEKLEEYIFDIKVK